MNRFFSGAIAAALTLTGAQAYAASTVFFDRAAFLAAAGPVTVDLQAPDFTAFGLTNGPNANAIAGDFSAAMPGCELAFSGDESFDLLFNTSSFPDPIFSFGLDFIEPTLNASQQGDRNGCNVAVYVDSTF